MPQAATHLHSGSEVVALPAVHPTFHSAAAPTPDRSDERRRRTDRRRQSRERRRQPAAELIDGERRNSNEDRRSGLDRRVIWADAPPRRFPLDQHLVVTTPPARIGTRIDLYV
jgi:hypothetical protein